MNAVPSGNFIGSYSHAPQSPNVDNIFLPKNGSRMIFSVGVTHLLHHVPPVIRVRSYPEMIRTHTSRHIAGVAHAQRFRKVTVFVRK